MPGGTFADKAAHMIQNGTAVPEGVAKAAQKRILKSKKPHQITGGALLNN
jgi:hypothetical protein